MESPTEHLEATTLEGLKVHFISLVGNPANKRAFLVKAASLDDLEVVEKQVKNLRKDASLAQVLLRFEDIPAYRETIEE